MNDPARIPHAETLTERLNRAAAERRTIRQPGDVMGQAGWTRPALVPPRLEQPHLAPAWFPFVLLLVVGVLLTLIVVTFGANA